MRGFIIKFSSIFFLLVPLAFANSEVSVKEVLSNDADVEAEELKREASTHKLNDELQRDTPRSSILGYLQAARSGDYEKAAKYLDLRNLPDEISDIGGEELARQLKVVLDRTLWIEIDGMNDTNDGHSDDNLPSYRDLVGMVSANEKVYEILYQRVPGEGKTFIWKFSNRTVADIPELYDHHGFNRIEEKLEEIFPRGKFLKIDLWMWTLALTVLFLSFFLAKPICMILVLLVRRMQPELLGEIERFINGPVRFMIMVYMAVILYRNNFHLTVEAQAIANAGTIRIVIHTWFFVRLVSLAKDYFANRLEKNDKAEAVVLLRPLATVLKIIIVIFASLLWLDNVGYNVTTLIAGLGIGGLAVALAAQKSLENLLGTITIYASAPIKIGDFCNVSGTMGTVEEIGLWATQIRTLDRSVIFVPNAQLSAGMIENFSKRDKFRFSRIINLAHETDQEVLSSALQEIEQYLKQNDRLDPDIQRVRLVTIGEYGFEVEIFTFILTVSMPECKQVTEEVNLAINSIVKRAGIEYAKALKPVPA